MRALKLFVFAAVASSTSIAHTRPGAREPGDLDKVVCKRLDVTGSLVQKKRICKTLREWDRTQADAREGAEGMTKNQCGGGPGCT